MPAGSCEGDVRCASPGQAAITGLLLIAGLCSVSCLVISTCICDLAPCSLSVKCTIKFNSCGLWLSRGSLKRKVMCVLAHELSLSFLKALFSERSFRFTSVLDSI